MQRNVDVQGVPQKKVKPKKTMVKMFKSVTPFGRGKLLSAIKLHCKVSYRHNFSSERICCVEMSVTGFFKNEYTYTHSTSI